MLGGVSSVVGQGVGFPLLQTRRESVFEASLVAETGCCGILRYTYTGTPRGYIANYASHTVAITGSPKIVLIYFLRRPKIVLIIT